MGLSPPTTVDDLLDQVEAGAADWRALTSLQRGDLLRRAADVLESRLEEMAQAIVESVGKPVREARAEAARAVAIFRYVGSLGASAQGSTWAADDPDTVVVTI